MSLDPSEPLSRLPYDPIIRRAPLSWPGGARVAFWLACNVEHREYLPPGNAARDPWPRSPHPDVRQYSHHEFGNRVGFWRFVEVMDDVAIPCTIALNLSVLDRFPEIGRAIVERDWEIMGHGLTNTRYLYDLDEHEEAAQLAECSRIALEHTGRPLLGMLGPSISASPNTPDVLAAAGMLYHADWVHDDQPTLLRVRSGRLVSVPYTYELNDAPLFRDHHEIGELVERARGQLECLLAEERASVMCVSVHPFLIAQPQRIDAFAELVRDVAATPGVWCTTAGAIATSYLEQIDDRGAVP